MHTFSIWLLGCATKNTDPYHNTSFDEYSSLEVCSYLRKKEECLGKMTLVVGKTPEMLYAHPIVPVDPHKNITQSYIQFEEQQLIVLSEKQIECDGTMEVTGTLNEINLGGPEGTRGSYQNYYFSQSIIRCLP